LERKYVHFTPVLQGRGTAFFDVEQKAWEISVWSLFKETGE